MMQSRDESPPSRHQLVVLASLSQTTPPNDVELGEIVHQLILPRGSAEAARQRATEILKQLVQRTWVIGDDIPPPRGKRRGKAHRPRSLTDNGKRVLREAFHLPRVPSWAKVRDRHLPALGLGLPSTEDITGRSLDEEALIAAVLGSQFGIRGASTPMSVCDAVIASALGMPPGRLTLDRMRAHVLLRGVDKQAPGLPDPGSKGYATKVAAWVACHAIGASGPTRRMARALARRWACDEPAPLGASVAAGAGSAVIPPAEVGSAGAAPARITPAGAAPVGAAPAGAPIKPEPARIEPAGPSQLPAPVAAQNLLEVVRETIPHIGAEGRFGEKVYVSAIWRSIDRERKVGGLSLDHFKRWLVRANRDGQLVLARADLIGAMDARQVNESEIHDRGATFHFVLDQQSDAPGSQRDRHAR